MPEIVDFLERQPFRLLVGSDHGGFELKNELVAALQQRGIAVADVGPHALDPQDDYPDYASLLASQISRGEADGGILICRTGIGMSIVANRYRGVRAALCHDPDAAEVSRRHNCSNLLVAAGDDMTGDATMAVVDRWLGTPYSDAERHTRRLLKVENTPLDVVGVVRDVDPEVAGFMQQEATRQDEIIELIASENVVSAPVQAAVGSCLTNKYAEGYPGKRYYGGCKFVDEIERLAIERAQELFGAESANVQAHSGSQANMAAYFALLEPGDKVLAMDLAHGGHLTHGLPINFSGRMYDFVGYGVAPESEVLDYDEIAKLARRERPKLLVAGASAYPRTIDFARLREIADSVDARLMVDMAHIAGLVAAGLHPSPVPHADIVTTTTHKTLRGPRGGLVLSRKPFAKRINQQIFPGIQGGPLMHVIAGKAVCLKLAGEPGFAVYQRQVIANARALAAALAERGFRIVSGGTDNHLMLVDLRPFDCTGIAAEKALDRAGITVNKNLIPFDPAKPTVTSGLRLGSPAITTRGATEADMARIADWILRVIQALRTDDGDALEEAVIAVRAEIATYTRRLTHIA